MTKQQTNRLTGLRHRNDNNEVSLASLYSLGNITATNHTKMQQPRLIINNNSLCVPYFDTLDVIYDLEHRGMPQAIFRGT